MPNVLSRDETIAFGPYGRRPKGWPLSPQAQAITPIISLTPNLIHAAHHANRSGQGGEHSDEDLEEFAPVEVFHCD